jgi:carbon storage regulator CsrA
MLVLSRKKNERIVCTCGCGAKTFISVAELRPMSVRLGIEAPETTVVHREEIQEEVDKEVGDGT